jgi:4-amino-4-deoxy-L-arabinose transferase-like glycosyltransferase
MRILRTYLPLAILLALNWALLYPRLASPNTDWDATQVYLPMAARLLSEGLGYFGQQASIEMPPFSYIWPALLGAKLEAVRMTNFLLSGATLVLIWRTGWVLHSALAGLAAAALFALCPTTKPFLASALSEPPYFFLMALWFWSLAEFYSSGRRSLLIITAISLGLASITRGSLFYVLPVLFIFFAIRRERYVAIAHGAALTIPLAFIAKNLILFGFAFFATGSGNALYLGHHPVTGGFDPYYMGIFFDTGSVTQSPSPLTLESERLMAGIARMMIFQADPAWLASLYAHKVAAFVFVTNLAPDGDVVVLRSWRILTLILAIAGFRAIASPALRWVIAITLAYQVVVHIPVLYTHRYSVGALDLWLALLAGLGLAALIERRSTGEVLVYATAAVAGLGAGWWTYRYGPEPQLDMLRSKHALVWETRGLRGVGRMEVNIPPSPLLDPVSNYGLLIDAASGCRNVTFSFRREGASEYGRSVTHRFDIDGKVHRYQFGALQPMQLQSPGRLRIETPCILEITRLALYKTDAGSGLRERYQQR